MHLVWFSTLKAYGGQSRAFDIFILAFQAKGGSLLDLVSDPLF